MRAKLTFRVEKGYGNPKCYMVTDEFKLVENRVVIAQDVHELGIASSKMRVRMAARLEAFSTGESA